MLGMVPVGVGVAKQLSGIAVLTIIGVDKVAILVGIEYTTSYPTAPPSGRVDG